MRDCVNFIRSRLKERSLFLAGFSLGGNVVAKYLGEEGRHSCVKGAVCVGVPFDLEVVAQNVENNLFGFYHYAIAVPYKERYARHADVLDSLQDSHRVSVRDALRSAKTVMSFDAVIIR